MLPSFILSFSLLMQLSIKWFQVLGLLVPLLALKGSFRFSDCGGFIYFYLDLRKKYQESYMSTLVLDEENFILLSILLETIARDSLRQILLG